MADASPETIQRLIDNSEKCLATIEMTLPTIMETRKVVVRAIEKQGGGNSILELVLVVLDSLLAENEVTYDISASLNSLLKATDDYTKRYYMQILNLCFWETCQLFVGDNGDEYGLLSRLEKLTQENDQAGCHFIVKHIVDDLMRFREKYADRELRNITRHYDNPIKMYEKQRELTNIDFFAKGANELLAIKMEVSVVTSFLLNLIAQNKKDSKKVSPASKERYGLNEIFNDAIFKAFKEKKLKGVVQGVLSHGKDTLDDCYSLYRYCCNVTEFLLERNLWIPDQIKKLEALILLRMETVYLKYDIACSIWGYINAASEMERSQNLRLVHITKQAALTHIYGYTESVRENSLWTRVKDMEEASSNTLNTHKVEDSLKELTKNLSTDRDSSNIFAHYRYKNNFYIPARLEAFSKMYHYKELEDSLQLINICKSIEKYMTSLMFLIDEKHKNEKKKQYKEWLARIDAFADKIGNDNKANDAVLAMKGLIDMVYGSKS